MLEQEVKVTDKQNSSSMPTLTEQPSEGELPIEVSLAILYTHAKRLEREGLAQVLTGHSPKGAPVTYIKLFGVTVDSANGFVLPESESVGSVE